MKVFRVCNNDLNNWCERTFYNAADVVRFVKSRKFETFEIEWKTPVTQEYTTLIIVENGKTAYISDVFKIPATFKQLINC